MKMNLSSTARHFEIRKDEAIYDKACHAKKWIAASSERPPRNDEDYSATTQRLLTRPIRRVALSIVTIER